MQNAPNAPANNPPNTWLNTYGPLILSALVVLLVSVGWLMGRIDETGWLALVGAILTGNGLVSATQWQAAPGLLNQLQTVIAQLTDHIQVLHAQQAANTPKLPQAVRSSTPPPLTQFPGPGRGPGGSSGG